MNAAFRLVSERRIHAAAKNSVVRPVGDQGCSELELLGGRERAALKSEVRNPHLA
jgi:hypothetical protein